jgi:hypothetical protein
MFDKYCVSCHNQRLRTAGFAIDTLDSAHPAANPEAWEKVIARLRAGSMPPPGRPRPDPATYRAVASALEHENRPRLAGEAESRTAQRRPSSQSHRIQQRDPRPVRARRRREAAAAGDETADGSFDNMADALSISTAHLERYMSVARQVTRLATGLPPTRPTIETFEIPLHVIQDERQSEDLPFGSRGGLAVRHDFPSDGEYAIKVRLQRQYQDYIKGMGWPQQLDVRLDHKLLKRFTVGGEAKGRPAASSYAGDGEPGFAGDDSWEKYMQIGGDAGLEVRVPVAAGPHVVGVAFVRQLWEPEGLPQPLQRGRVITDDQVYMGYASVGSVQIGGPYQIRQEGRERQERQERGERQPVPPAHRRAVFVCQPASVAEEKACATRILSRMARLAYRRPATNQGRADAPPVFRQRAQRRRQLRHRHSVRARADAGRFLTFYCVFTAPPSRRRNRRRFRRDQPSPGPASQRDLAIASRLSFFLWGSIPDDRLLTLAERGQLTSPSTFEKEVRRMLADPRASESLVNDFAAQWLNLRRVDEVVVDPERYPNYDLSLLQGFQRETELFVGSTIREDRSVVALLNADYTFVNERLARHYGIPGIYGSRFRRVTLPNPDQRGGLLAEGALLATTSYPDRTSPVLRGKWLLNNIFGLPIPPPPPGVDQNLPEGKPGEAPPSMRERLAQHRASPSCASCHAAIDPLGFALENFDVIGGWRTVDESGRPVDASGQTVSGAKVEGLAWPPGAAARGARSVSAHGHRKTARLRDWAAARVLRSSGRPHDRARSGGARLPVVVDHSRHYAESHLPDEDPMNMTFLTAKSLPRRTVLRGLGATMALPFLEAMIPARRGLAAARPAHRFQTFYVPNGMAMEHWRPKGEGAAFELSPILEPLAPYRNQMLVLSGIKANWNYIHAGASGSFLTGTVRGGRNEIEIVADVSMDQLLARRFGSETQVASLELSMDAPANAGACTGNLSCVYTHTLSWRSPTQPLPMEWNPRAVFERLFGDSGSTDRTARETRLRQHKSILDSVTAKLASLKKELGAWRPDQDRRVRRSRSRRRAPHSESRAAVGARAADDRAAAGRAAGVRRPSRADAGPAAAGVPVGPHARRLVHDRQGAERAAVPADRRARGAPSAVASQRRPGVDRAHVEDQPVSHRAVRQVSGEAARHGGRRRVVARFT